MKPKVLSNFKKTFAIIGRKSNGARHRRDGGELISDRKLQVLKVRFFELECQQTEEWGACVNDRLSLGDESDKAMAVVMVMIDDGGLNGNDAACCWDDWVIE